MLDAPGNPFAPSASADAPGNPFVQVGEPKFASAEGPTGAGEAPGLFKSAMAGINYDGIAQTLGLPVDAVAGAINLALRQIRSPELINAPLRALRSVEGPDLGQVEGPDLGQIESPVGGAESIRNLMGAMSVPNPAPTTPGETFARRIGQEIGSAAATAGLPFAQAARSFGSLGRAMSAPAQEAMQAGRLGRYAATEATAALGAGVGGALAQNQAPDSALAETLGQIGGAVIPGLVSGAVRQGSALLQSPMPNQVKARAAAELQSAVDDKGAALLRMDDTLPRARELNTPLSTAQASADPGLAALERGASRGPNQTRWAILRNEQNAALTEALDATEPTAKSSGRALVQNLRGGAAPDPGPAVRSANLRSAVDQQYEAFRSQAKKLYDAVDPDDGVFVRLGRVRDVAQRAVNDQGTLGGSSQFPEGTIADVLNSGEAVSFNQLRKFRERLNAEIKTAGRAGEGGKSRVLGEMKSAVDNVIDDVMQGGQSLYGTKQGVDPNEAVTRLREANAFYQENAPRFKEGTAAKVLGVKGAGVTPEQTGAAFLKPDEAGGAQAAQDLLKVLKGERSPGQKYLASDLASVAFDNRGAFNATGLRNWLGERPVAIGAFFGDPKNMRDLITSPGARGNMKRLIAIGEGDPQLMSKIRQGFWDTMSQSARTQAQDQAGNQNLTVAGLSKFIDKNADLLPVVYRNNQEQLGRIYQIRDTMRDIARPEQISRTGVGSDTAQNQGAKKLAGRVAERFLDVAAQTAGVDPTTRSLGRFVSMIGGAAKDLLTRRDAVDRMIIDAMIDPDLAKSLLTRTEGRKSVLAKQYIERYLQQALGQQGRIQAVDGGEELQP